MAHVHPVYDTDHHFTIDPYSRGIKYESDAKLTIMQGDHNCERFTFDIPRYIEDHDMSVCNKVEIHYINAGTSGRANDVYIVEDLEISTDDTNIVYFSWLLSANATQFAGTLNFTIIFKCLTGSTIDYAWNTSIFTGIKVGETIQNSEQAAMEYSDIFTKWLEELRGAGIISVEEIEAAKVAAIAEINTMSLTAIEEARDEAIEAITEAAGGIDAIKTRLSAPIISLEGMTLKVVSFDSNTGSISLYMNGVAKTHSMSTQESIASYAATDGIYTFAVKAYPSDNIAYSESDFSNTVVYVVGDPTGKGLSTPRLSISGTTLTVSDIDTNSTDVKFYRDGVHFTTVTRDNNTSITYSLASISLDDGIYTFTVKVSGTDYDDSDFSNTIAYITGGISTAEEYDGTVVVE